MSSARPRTARVLAAFALANARYWLCIAAQVRREMRHWEARAQAIEDPALRALALAKLRAEGFNAEAAAMAATIAPRATRGHAVRAIVALELLYDYLDGLSERPHADPLGEGERLYAAFVGALDPSVNAPGADDYLGELCGTVRRSLARLPAREAIAPYALQCAARGAQAQTRMHATHTLGAAQLGEWARGEAHGTTLQWREFAAGAACSVLALHALIAAAADPHTTPEQAQAIDTAYLFTGAMVTLLDGVVDH
jgi:tetraprenyl-beta-curcumene synthase